MDLLTLRKAATSTYCIEGFWGPEGIWKFWRIKNLAPLRIKQPIPLYVFLLLILGGRSVGLTTLSPSGADCLEIWEPESPGTLRACPGLQWGCFTVLYQPEITPNTMQFMTYIAGINLLHVSTPRSILRESIRLKEHKANTQIKTCFALTGMIKILKF
jgi:hypothetical protein